MVSSDLLVRCFLVARTTSRPEQLSLVPPQNRFWRRPLQRPPASRLQAMDADAASRSRAACHSAFASGVMILRRPTSISRGPSPSDFSLWYMLALMRLAVQNSEIV